MNTLLGGEAKVTSMAKQFEATDLGAPFKVILHDSVKVSSNPITGEHLSYTIPDVDGLICAVVMSRIIDPRKLHGKDIKWIRKALSIKQKDMARIIDLSPEHLSRCEADSQPMSPSSEKLFRIYALKVSMKFYKVKDCEEKTKLEDALDAIFDLIKPIAVYDIEDVLELHFRRKPYTHRVGSNDDDSDGKWDSGSLKRTA